MFFSQMPPLIFLKLLPTKSRILDSGKDQAEAESEHVEILAIIIGHELSACEFGGFPSGFVPVRWNPLVRHRFGYL